MLGEDGVFRGDEILSPLSELAKSFSFLVLAGNMASPSRMLSCLREAETFYSIPDIVV